MKNYNKLVDSLKTLTIEDLNEVKNNVMKCSEKKPLTDTPLDEFIKNNGNKEYSDEYTDYYRKLGLIALEKTIDDVIDDKEEEQLTQEMIAYVLAYKNNNSKELENDNLN